MPEVIYRSEIRIERRWVRFAKRICPRNCCPWPSPCTAQLQRIIKFPKRFCLTPQPWIILWRRPRVDDKTRVLNDASTRLISEHGEDQSETTSSSDTFMCD